MGGEQGLQQQLEASAAQRPRGGVLVQNEIQAGHVDALGLGVGEVDVHLHPGVRSGHRSAVAEGKGLADVAHAHPVQGALGALHRAAGDVRHGGVRIHGG